jgi:hypothetical protein
MSQLGRFDPGPATSGLPLRTDIVRPPRHVSKVPRSEVNSRHAIGDIDNIGYENRREANGASFRHSGKPKPFSQFRHIGISSKGLSIPDV